MTSSPGPADEQPAEPEPEDGHAGLTASCLMALAAEITVPTS